MSIQNAAELRGLAQQLPPKRSRSLQRSSFLRGNLRSPGGKSLPHDAAHMTMHKHLRAEVKQSANQMS
jgi:hypothetical protein